MVSAAGGDSPADTLDKYFGAFDAAFTQSGVVSEAISKVQQYHNFMSDKEVIYVTDDVLAQDTLDRLYDRLSGFTDASPLLATIDTETCANRQILLEYQKAQTEFMDARKVFETYPTKDRTPQDQLSKREQAQRFMEDKRKALTIIAKKANKGGLNVGSGQVRLVQIYLGGKAVAVFDRWAISQTMWDKLCRFLEDTRLVWLGHNVLFDVKMMGQHGCMPTRAPHCTMLADQAMTSVSVIRRTLAALTERYLQKKLSKEQQASDWGNPVLNAEQIVYAAADVVATYEVFRVLDAKIAGYHPIPEADIPSVYNLMRSNIIPVAQMMLRGVPFNREWQITFAKKLKADDIDGASKVMDAINKCALPNAPKVENPGSNKQIAEWIRYHLNNLLPFDDTQWPRTQTGQLAVGKDDLILNRSKINSQVHPVIDALADWSRAKKWNSDWGKDFDEYISPITGNVHASIRIGGAETGRYSVTDPALQTMPRQPEFRRLVKARKGRKILCADYGQIEVRVPATMANDAVLIDAINRGLDVHSLTAINCFATHPDTVALIEELKADGVFFDGMDYLAAIALTEVKKFFKEGDGKWMRQVAKACIFGLIFGQGASGLVSVLATQGIHMTQEEAGEIQRGLLRVYSGLRRWIMETRDRAEKTKYIWTPLGRAYEPVGALYTKSINTPCQGGAAEIVQNAIRKFPAAWGGRDCHLILQVHDELIADCEESIAAECLKILKDTMADAAKELFPNIPDTNLVEGNFGDTWEEAK